MSARLPLPAEVLRGQRPLPAEVDAHTHDVVHRLLDLANRGEYLAAAEEAAELLRGSAHDARLIAIYLMGDFIERGVTALPELLARIDVLLGPERATSLRIARQLESTVEWLIRSITDRIAFHTQRRDEVWSAWIEATGESEVAEIIARSEQLCAKSSTGATNLPRLSRWAREKLGPAAARARSQKPVEPPPIEQPRLDPEPEPRRWDAADDELEPVAPPPEPSEPELEGDDFDDAADSIERAQDFDDDPDDEDLDDAQPIFAPHSVAPGYPAAAHSRGHLASPPTPSDLDSPALTHLRRKLHGFELLLSRGEFEKAAVIARDIQAALDDFDPILYLPALFARYLKLLSRSLAEIERFWSSEDSTARRVLEQLYRADLDGFIDD